MAVCAGLLFDKPECRPGAKRKRDTWFKERNLLWRRIQKRNRAKRQESGGAGSSSRQRSPTKFYTEARPRRDKRPGFRGNGRGALAQLGESVDRMAFGWIFSFPCARIFPDPALPCHRLTAQHLEGGECETGPRFGGGCVAVPDSSGCAVPCASSGSGT
jgi:hypothetical protein